MTTLIRTARSTDLDAVLALWSVLFDEPDASWIDTARVWLSQALDRRTDRVVVADVDGTLVASAAGIAETCIPNPYCPRGRLVRLSHVVTLPTFRGHGHATALVENVIAWARDTVQADRVDLSATPNGRPIYERLGFTLTTAPRMKLDLSSAR